MVIEARRFQKESVSSSKLVNKKGRELSLFGIHNRSSEWNGDFHGIVVLLFGCSPFLGRAISMGIGIPKEYFLL
jgi:hypothetical protein